VIYEWTPKAAKVENLKKSKIDNVIQNHKIFMEILDKNSIEYNTEISDLKTLEEISAKLIKE
jgi:hypothetical protein